MKIMHLTASPFFGGPERVILDIVRSQRELFGTESLVVSFRENGGCEPFIRELDRAGIASQVLVRDMPHLLLAARELTRLIRSEKIDILCAHGHKSRFVGWISCRRAGIPVVGVSHGWTWQDWKTSLYERLDQWVHHRMDRVVCVSQGQADKVIATGTSPSRVLVIHNAIDARRFSEEPSLTYRKQLESLFENPVRMIFGAAGRLSPEKGYDLLIDAVKLLEQRLGSDFQSFGLVLFGDGFLREPLQNQINALGLNDRFKLFGFTSELDRFLPHLDVFVQSSRTEGFPCVNLEAMASGVPVLATAVGGVPEQICDRWTGRLVEPEKSAALAEAMYEMFIDPAQAKRMGSLARECVLEEWTCEKQATRYQDLFLSLQR